MALRVHFGDPRVDEAVQLGAELSLHQIEAPLQGIQVPELRILPARGRGSAWGPEGRQEGPSLLRVPGMSPLSIPVPC